MKTKKQVDNLLLKKIKNMLHNKQNEAPVSQYMQKLKKNRNRIQEEMNR